MREDVNVVGQRELLRDHAGGIMITEHDIDGDRRFAEANHLFAKDETRVVALPIAVVEIAGDQDEVDRSLDGEIDHVLEGLARGVAHFFGGRARIVGQPGHRAVEVNVCCMEEFH